MVGQLSAELVEADNLRLVRFEQAGILPVGCQDLGQFALLPKVFDQAEEVAVAADDDGLVVVRQLLHGVKDKVGVNVALDGRFFLVLVIFAVLGFGRRRDVHGGLQYHQEAQVVHVLVELFVFAHVADEHVGLGDAVFVAQELAEFAPIELPAHTLSAEVQVLAIDESEVVRLLGLVWHIYSLADTPATGAV